jgi:hypothetical protein
MSLNTNLADPTDADELWYYEYRASANYYRYYVYRASANYYRGVTVNDQGGIGIAGIAKGCYGYSR